MPAPRLAWVEPWVKLVLAPRMLTVRDWPGAPVLGVTEMSCGPGLTVRAAVLAAGEGDVRGGGAGDGDAVGGGARRL